MKGTNHHNCRFKPDQTRLIRGQGVKINYLILVKHYYSGRYRDEALVERARAKILIRKKMRLHLLLFDPVPGNQILTTKMLDPMCYTTANSAIDVTSSAGVLRRVLAIYPYEPLPAITFHAPLVPVYPDRHCVVEEVVSLGCMCTSLSSGACSIHTFTRTGHQGAILCAPNRISCRLSYCMIRPFLQEHCRIRLRACRPFDECLATLSSKLRVLEMLRIAASEDAHKQGGKPNSIFINRPAHSKTANVRIVVTDQRFLCYRCCGRRPLSFASQTGMPKFSYSIVDCLSIRLMSYNISTAQEISERVS